MTAFKEMYTTELGRLVKEGAGFAPIDEATDILNEAVQKKESFRFSANTSAENLRKKVAEHSKYFVFDTPRSKEVRGFEPDMPKNLSPLLQVEFRNALQVNYLEAVVAAEQQGLISILEARRIGGELIWKTDVDPILVNLVLKEEHQNELDLLRANPKEKLEKRYQQAQKTAEKNQSQRETSHWPIENSEQSTQTIQMEAPTPPGYKRITGISLGFTAGAIVASACAPITTGVIVPTEQKPATETATTPPTPAKSTETPTPAKPTEPPTAEPSPTKEEQKTVSICTPDNFYKPEFNYDWRELFNGTLVKAYLKRPTPFKDPSKLDTSVPLNNYIGGGMNIGRNEITFSQDRHILTHGPTFPIKGSEPFTWECVGHTEYQDGYYAITMIRFYNVNDPANDVGIVAVHRFYDKENTDELRSLAMHKWAENMHLPVLLSTNLAPGYVDPDPLVAMTFADPDIQNEIAAATSTSTTKPGGNIAKLNGKVFQFPISWQRKNWYSN